MKMFYLYRIFLTHTLLLCKNLEDILGNDYTEEKATKLIEQVDTSKSGQISFEDFLSQFQTSHDKLLRRLTSRNENKLVSEDDVMQIARNEFEKIPSLREVRSSENEARSKSKVQNISNSAKTMRI